LTSTVVTSFTVYTQTRALLCRYKNCRVATECAGCSDLNTAVVTSNCCGHFQEHASVMFNARHATLNSAGLHNIRCRDSRPPTSGKKHTK